MEEWVGERWHRFIWRAADASYQKSAVRLEEVTRAVQMLFRAGGGDPLIRVVPATEERIGGPRSWLQKVAGQGERAALSTLDEETLALPPVIAVFPEDDGTGTEEIDDGTLKIALIGRPNVGKSSITNDLIGKKRSIVSDVAGTTRDAIDTVIEREGRKYRLIDTAGMRKKGKVTEDLEFYSVMRSIRVNCADRRSRNSNSASRAGWPISAGSASTPSIRASRSTAGRFMDVPPP